MPNPFATTVMAAGYAHARPPVHARVIELLRKHFDSLPVPRALDVGCGAGLSTRALAPLATERIAIDPAEGMLRYAHDVAPGAQFIVASAEALPFPAAHFDLISAAGSLNYVDLPRFFVEARRVLRPQGILAIYDFSTGSSFRESHHLDRWFQAFIERYPWEQGEATALDPEILARISEGFEIKSAERFEIALTLSPDFYLEYILTETNVANAVRRGTPLHEIREWCARTLQPVWQGRERDVLFRGYLACLVPHS
jgi:SAM-dependent methyltransferase